MMGQVQNGCLYIRYWSTYQKNEEEECKKLADYICTTCTFGPCCHAQWTEAYTVFTLDKLDTARHQCRGVAFTLQ